MTSSGTTPRDLGFWLIIVALFIATLLTAIEFTAIGTALPVIVNDLGGGQFVWVGSAYTLGSAALLPFTGGLAQIFGRRPVMLGSLLLFCIGSAVCGASKTMNMLIAGRTIQGLGSGSLTALVQIIIADLVPLRERGSFNGLMALQVDALRLARPFLTSHLNLPICALDAVLVAVFLRLRTPVAPLCEKLRRMDWFGNLLIISSSTSVVIALTWGGIEFPWTSARVLVPLILGLLGLIAFIVPLMLVPDRTAFSGYAQNFLMGVVLATIAYWLSVYFQACKEASPIAAGVDGFGLSYAISPTAIIIGLVIQKTQRYRQPLWFGWALMILGTALMSTLKADTARGKSYGYQFLVGVGIGITYIETYFPVLSSVAVTQAAPALAFFTFLRNFALVWGVTLGGAILQNQLKHNLPADYLKLFPHGAEIAFSAIPTIAELQQPLKDEVRKAFADALQVVWEVLIAVSALGLLISGMMKHLPLHTSVDSAWGRQEAGAKSEDVESNDKA
ncbi:MFS general substrate transporter [Auriscalpium vulgare]|uniref:MFS general substrate transporter n=1 Tax=Auriscalpium vulgare TaxID=40419 RepID=A0ACB8S619_9AGAM|nr:MFS general substrate transporter [Auriscalpium vulgare]